MIAVKCENVSKSFDDKKALDTITLEMQKGKIYALLGRNGAGKTTLMNCLCTKYLPDTGEISLLGEVAYENEKVLHDICFMSDNMDVFETKSVKDILKFAEAFYEKWNEKLKQKLLAFFGIELKMLYNALSKGQKTVVSMIIGLCSGCQIVLFDEIYSGLDAAARKSFYEILMDEQEKMPRTFVLSTHLIEEMSSVFTDVIIMDKGKILLNEDMETIHEKSFQCVGRTDQADALEGKNVICKNEMGTVTQYHIYDTLTKEEQQKLEEQGFTITSLALQELFIAMTEKEHGEWSDFDGTN